jgi:hypothetical protein
MNSPTVKSAAKVTGAHKGNPGGKAAAAPVKGSHKK